jgi:IclR family pca regulon transcriptional regulator
MQTAMTEQQHTRGAYFPPIPYLEELRERTSYTASLGVLEGGDVLYVECVRRFCRSQRMSDLDLHSGSRLPAYCTAIGKLLLANLPKPEQRELLAATKLTKRAPKTITSKRALREEFEEIKLAGFGCSDQEFAVGVLAVIQVARVTKRMRSWQRIRADGMAGTVTAQDEN